MFKLPICPHCSTIYRYGDTKKAIRKKDNECYHCHKTFRTKIFPYVLIEAAVLIAASIGLNVLILFRSSSLSLVPLFAVTVGFLILIYLLIPFFTHFKKTEEDKKYPKKNERKRKK